MKSMKRNNFSVQPMSPTQKKLLCFKHKNWFVFAFLNMKIVNVGNYEPAHAQTI